MVFGFGTACFRAVKLATAARLAIPAGGAALLPLAASFASASLVASTSSTSFTSTSTSAFNHHILGRPSAGAPIPTTACMASLDSSVNATHSSNVDNNSNNTCSSSSSSSNNNNNNASCSNVNSNNNDHNINTNSNDQSLLVALLVSATRSSLVIVVVAEGGQLESALAYYNTNSGCPIAISVLRPWRVAVTRPIPEASLANVAARRIAHQSGFRARLRTLQALDFGSQRLLTEAHSSSPLPATRGSAQDLSGLDLSVALDGLTYVQIEVSNPTDAQRKEVVLALVDTGSTDSDLKPSIIEKLGLTPLSRPVRFETASGRMVSRTAMTTRLKVIGFDMPPVDVLVSPTDDEEESENEDDVDALYGFGTSTDDAILGYRALKELGLLVDCASKRLLQFRPEMESWPQVYMDPATGMHVDLHVGKPGHEGTVQVRSLVDTGSTDLDLPSKALKELKLEVDPDEAVAFFETSGGETIEAPIYRAEVRMLGRQCSLRASPSEPRKDDSDSDEDEEDDEEEEALMGHDALAAIGLLVDCRRGRLLAAPPRF
eukprot:CAMPEP_0206442850 /NCGR_PEP_ID=MMETSP0324_2-20121206/14048_1 /ASSEMBLY_ACC=CAM_ASM_000836 /TAXON_ID=2866 /ORGANISM="Crypthecodinium cohnii, Strain Seligo" /LENGTH=545 /DNA_ID=CAMNT_0053910733 /DNA_START=120 /DNA_END=1757 /DNA_ORIENTATION=+